MRFWDASAVVPLVALERETGGCRKLLAEDTDVVVWFLTPVEVVSALTRRLRENSLKPNDFTKAKEQLAILERAWSEVGQLHDDSAHLFGPSFRGRWGASIFSLSWRIVES